MTARSRPLVAPCLALALVLAACGEDEAKPAAPAADASPEAPASAPADAAATLADATREFAGGNCAVARRKLEQCAACESAEQKPQRDLLLAYCKEREAPAEARALYEAIITDHPSTEASVIAIMRVRQIDAAELPPLAEAAGAKPAPRDRPQPAYPSLAEAAGVEGKVRLRFDVQDDGSVANVRVIESTPPLLFDSVALYAVSSWQYEPGQAAASQQVALRFDLPEDETTVALPEAPAASAGETAK